MNIAGKLGNNLGPTNMFILISAPKSCPVSWFLPKLSLQGPKRGPIISFNFCSLSTNYQEVTLAKDDLSIISGIDLLDCSKCGQGESAVVKDCEDGNPAVSVVNVETVPSNVHVFTLNKNRLSDHHSSNVSSTPHHLAAVTTDLPPVPCTGVDSLSDPITSTPADVRKEPSGRCIHRPAYWSRFKKSKKSSEVEEDTVPVSPISNCYDELQKLTVSEDNIWYQSPMTVKGFKIS